MAPGLRDPAHRIQTIKGNILNLITAAVDTIESHHILNGISPPTNANTAAALVSQVKRHLSFLTQKCDNLATLANEWRAIRNGEEQAEAEYVQFVEENDVNAKRQRIDLALSALKDSLDEAISYKENLTREHVSVHSEGGGSRPRTPQPEVTLTGRPVINSRLQDFFNRHESQPRHQTQHPEDDHGNRDDEERGQSNQPRSQDSARRSQVGRAKLQPLIFRGDFLEYNSWKIWFINAFDVPELDTTEKAQYLKTMVDGEAADAIRGIELRCFRDMMSALDASFDRPDIVRRLLLQKARDIRPSKDLRQFIRDIKVIRRQMTQNNLNWDSPLAIQELEEKWYPQQP